jgi:hypothetical protein
MTTIKKITSTATTPVLLPPPPFSAITIPYAFDLRVKREVLRGIYYLEILNTR